MGVLERVFKAVLSEVVKPDSFVKGDEFESFIRRALYPQNDFNLIHRTHDYTSNKNDYIETSKEPDFKFKSRKNGDEFYVEAKFRSGFYKQTIEWCKPYQLKRYKAIEIDKKIPIFVVIGVGALPKSPLHVYRIPLKDIKYTKLYRSFLNKYEISRNQMF